MNLLKKIFKKKPYIKKLNIKNKIFKVSGPKQNITFRLDDDNNLKVNIEGNIEISINGELNILSSSDIAIDTVDSRLYLNSKMASQIRDKKESIEYREKQRKELKKMQSHAIALTPVLEPVENPNHDNREIIHTVSQKQKDLLNDIIEKGD